MSQIQITAGLAVSNGPYRQPQLGGPFQQEQTTARGGTPGLLSLTTAEQDVDFGDVTPGWVFVKNLSSENAMLIGPKNAGDALEPFLELPPLAQVVLPLDDGVVLRVAAAAGTLDAQIVGVNQ
ncbi:hypothetical protein [Desulfonatronospira sp.]|uniref:hypothetical protein n=1 Tax=Desulfonatronospira sp. TaxID=1962951 RepID=UPI0025BBE62F|nr:hypothetical protein [Desulfonatronospira sp.]